MPKLTSTNEIRGRIVRLNRTVGLAYLVEDTPESDQSIYAYTPKPAKVLDGFKHGDRVLFQLKEGAANARTVKTMRLRFPPRAA